MKENHQAENETQPLTNLNRTPKRLRKRDSIHFDNKNSAPPILSVLVRPKPFPTMSYDRETETYSVAVVYDVEAKDAEDNEENEAFGKAAIKGAKLMEAMLSTEDEAVMMMGNDSESAESNFTDFDDLKKWGYRALDYDDYFDFDISLPIKPALESMGASTKKVKHGGNNRAFIWEHEVETEHEGKRYPPTGASYTTIYNLDDGVIIGWGAFSPAYMALKQIPPVTTLPELKSWSDVTFLQWLELHKSAYKMPGQGSSKTSNLRYILKTPCENRTTQLVIRKSLKNKGVELKKWPGTTFSMDEGEGRAILGSPNGQGVGYLLAQHKRWLGRKFVKKVTIFQDEGRSVPRPPSVLFYIGDGEGVA